MPVSGTFNAEFVASELIPRLPLTLPLEAGENVTLKLALWPGFKVMGSVRALALNPAPLAPAAEIVTVAVPEFVRVSVIVCDAPTRTLPNPRLAELGMSWLALIPVPDTGRETIEELTLVPLCPLPLAWMLNEIATLPLLVPVAAGVNVTLQLMLCPPFTVTG
jgi:hypothetical protein